MAHEKWTSRDFGEAMRRAVEAHSGGKFHVRGDRVWFQPWWREGAHRNCVVSVSKGNWSDLRDGPTGGNAKAFAELALGDTLVGMMKRYGSFATYDVIVRPAAPPPADDLTSTWTDIVRLGRKRGALTAWLRARGVEPEHHPAAFTRVAIVDDYGMLPPAPAEELAKWRFLERAGPCACFPLRAPDGRVCNLHLRPLGKFERRVFLPGVSLRDGDLPLSYGDPQDAIEGGDVLLVEGAFDALAAALVSGAVAVGAPGAGMMPSYADWLRGKLRAGVIMAPQLDQHQVGQRAAAKALVALRRMGIPARFIDWDALADGVPSPKDIGDVCRAIGSRALQTRMRSLM